MTNNSFKLNSFKKLMNNKQNKFICLDLKVNMESHFH